MYKRQRSKGWHLVQCALAAGAAWAIAHDLLGHAAPFFAPIVAVICLGMTYEPVSYTHLRAHETVLDLVCRLLLEKKKIRSYYYGMNIHPIITVGQSTFYIFL